MDADIRSLEERERPKRFGHHPNTFGFLRLLFASLVIVSHTPELVDGNRSREILSNIFGTISFGELAVDGFFIISGFLISASFLSSKSVLNYAIKRIIRIYPGFMVATAVCVVIVAYFGGASWSSIVSGWHFYIKEILFLIPPNNHMAFLGSHYPDLNGSMWTISYEFRCYILVIILGFLGVLERPMILMFFSIVGLIAALSVPLSAEEQLARWHLQPQIWLGHIVPALRLTALFLAGAAFRGALHRIPLRRSMIFASIFCLCVCLCFHPTAEIGVAIFGSYLIFAISVLSVGTVLERINNQEDISYGVYLYAWPIEKLLIASGLGFSLLLLGVVTWIAALACGAISWFAVEKPVMKLVRARLTSRAQTQSHDFKFRRGR